MRRSFSRASQRGQPSVRAALRDSIRQGAQSGCGAWGVGRASSATRELLKVVVFDCVAEVVEFARGAVADVAVALVEVMRVAEAGVGPELDRPGAGRHRLRLDQADQGAAEALAADTAGDVQLQEQR